MLYELFSQQLSFIYSRIFQNLVEDITANISFLNDYNIAKLRDLFKKKFDQTISSTVESDQRRFQAYTSLTRSYF